VPAAEVSAAGSSADDVDRRAAAWGPAILPFKVADLGFFLHEDEYLSKAGSS
jgi:hypothetical protein